MEVISGSVSLYPSEDYTDRHGKDSTLKSKALHDQAVRELEILYTYKHKVLQRDQNIFVKDIDYHIKGDTNYIRQWINTHQEVILKSMKDAKLLSILNVRTLYTYFAH